MGMLESPADMPDVFGLPEYRVKDARAEIDGRDVRIAFAEKRFGHVEWRYTVVMTPEELMQMCHLLQVFAAEAIGILRLGGEPSEMPRH